MSQSPNPPKAKRPNILFLFTDQHRWDYVGYAGADFVKTPNLDRLAAQGTRFSRTYTNCPICAPARIALATGQAPFRVAPQSNASFLPLSRPTYYQRLRDKGYEVGVVGKLDLSKAGGALSHDGNRPLLYYVWFTRSFETEGKCNAGVVPRVHGPYTALLAERGLFEDFHVDYKRRGKGELSRKRLGFHPAGRVVSRYLHCRQVGGLDQPDYRKHAVASFCQLRRAARSF